jgi:hypothetical protein
VLMASDSSGNYSSRNPTALLGMAGMAQTARVLAAREASGEGVLSERVREEIREESGVQQVEVACTHDTRLEDWRGWRRNKGWQRGAAHVARWEADMRPWCGGGREKVADDRDPLGFQILKGFFKSEKSTTLNFKKPYLP